MTFLISLVGSLIWIKRQDCQKWVTLVIQSANAFSCTLSSCIASLTSFDVLSPLSPLDNIVLDISNALMIGSIDKYGAMQRQRGTFGFHEQGESTRLKIYFYVTAIWFRANPTLRDYRATTSTWTCCPCKVSTILYLFYCNAYLHLAFSTFFLVSLPRHCIENGLWMHLMHPEWTNLTNGPLDIPSHYASTEKKWLALWHFCSIGSIYISINIYKLHLS